MPDLLITIVAIVALGQIGLATWLARKVLAVLVFGASQAWVDLKPATDDQRIFQAA